MKRLAVIILIMAVLFTALIACVKTPPEPNPNLGNNNNKDSFWTEGFTKDRATATEMINDLIGGAMQTLKQASQEVVPKNSYKIALNAKLNIEYNGVKSYLIVKSNYDDRKPEDTVAMIEIYETSSNKLQMGFYLYQKEDFTNIYINLDGNKIKIPLTEYNISDMFPLQMKFSPAASSLVASGFLLFMNIKGDIDYEYKTVNNYCERHYRFNVDIAKSLANLVGMDSYWQETMGISKNEVDLLLRNLLGISNTDVQNGNIPDTAIKVEFTTVSGNPDYFGVGKLSKLKMDVGVKSMKTGDTVFGKDFAIQLDATSIVISNSVVSNVPKESAFADYVDYANRKFRLYTVAKEDNATEACDVTVDFIYDAFNEEQTNFSVTAIGQQSKQEIFSIFYKDNYIYINWKNGGLEKNVEGAFYFNKFLKMMESEIKANPNLSFLNILSYVMANLRLQNNQVISYHFEPQFFVDIGGISQDKLLNMLNECAEEDFTAKLAEAGADIASLYKSFTLSIVYGKTVIEQIAEIDFPDVLNSLK